VCVCVSYGLMPYEQLAFSLHVNQCQYSNITGVSKQ